MKKQLTEEFVVELMKMCLRNKNVLKVAQQHIKYQYLPSEQHKDVWKVIVTYCDTIGKPPTIGYLTEQFTRNIKVLELIRQIKNAGMPNKDTIFDQLETFIKTSIFLKAYRRIGDLYNEEKQVDAFVKMQEFAEEINSFSIKQSYFDMVFEQHNERYVDRKVNAEAGLVDTTKVPTGIHELDDITHGGVNIGDTFLGLAQSGVGKTKFLRSVGVSAARRGHKVLHIQAEGSRQECLDGYDATWSGAKLNDIEYATISEETRTAMKKAANNVRANGGEIYVEAFEQFDTVNLQDVRQSIIEIEKVHGKLDAVLLDYFELFDPGDGKSYKVSEERQRREAVGNGLKNIAIEFQVAIFTMTQASTVSQELLNDGTFVQTRFDISEFKGAIKPFSYFITLNQTRDEYADKVMRLYVDKIRKYKGGQIIKIAQRYDRERFYDGKRTLSEFYSGIAA